MGQASSSSLYPPKIYGSATTTTTTTTTKHQQKRQDEGGGGGKGEEEEDLTSALPDECLATVLAKLGTGDRNSCSLVCKRWSLVDSKTRHRLLLAAHAEISPSLPSLLSRFDAVSALSLKCSRKRTSLDDDGLLLVAGSLSSLRKLKLKGCLQITDAGLVASSRLLAPTLRKLSFAACGFSGRGLDSILSRCRLLQDLTLKRLSNIKQQLLLHDLDDADADAGGNGGVLGCLERLCLKDLHNASLIAPLVCACCKSLKTLIVCRCAGMWDLVFGGGLRCSALIEIQLENLQLSDAGLAAISSACVGLEVIYISRASHCTDTGFAAVGASCGKLRKLHIDACGKFGGNYGGVGDDGVVSIAAKCSQLQEVVLMGVALTVLSLDALASNCPSLERMALCNIDSVGDAELGFVAAKFSALRKLCIKNCPVTDAGIEAIAVGCPNLVKLKVKRCREVTQANVSQLRLVRESLVISLDVESLSMGEEAEMAAEEQQSAAAVQGGGWGTRMGRLPTTSSRTHVVCGSRGANLIKSKLGTALTIRRPSIPPLPSSRTARR